MHFYNLIYQIFPPFSSLVYLLSKLTLYPWDPVEEGIVTFADCQLFPWLPDIVNIERPSWEPV
jgi:hypothetical protein